MHGADTNNETNRASWAKRPTNSVNVELATTTTPATPPCKRPRHGQGACLLALEFQEQLHVEENVALSPEPSSIGYWNEQGHLILTTSIENDDEYDQYWSSDEDRGGCRYSENEDVNSEDWSGNDYPDENSSQDSLKDSDDNSSNSGSTNGDRNAFRHALTLSPDALLLHHDGSLQAILRTTNYKDPK
jgi:hypothetical protein